MSNQRIGLSLCLVLLLLTFMLGCKKIAPLSQKEYQQFLNYTAGMMILEASRGLTQLERDSSRIVLERITDMDSAKVAQLISTHFTDPQKWKKVSEDAMRLLEEKPIEKQIKGDTNGF